MKIYHLVRVYGDGSAVASNRFSQGKKSWLEYNQKFRPGCALFVDGHHASPENIGFNSAQIDFIEKAIQAELAAGKIDLTRIDRIGPQVEDAGSIMETRYRGYRPEANRNSFQILKLKPAKIAA